ncbi:alpha/beta fold hydrolase [soil metagenome]
MQLAYDDNGTGPVVVLLHGFPLDRSLWSAQVAGLRDRYRVIVPDLRGHGDSPSPAGSYPMEAMADDIAGLLEALRIEESVVLGGLSMGGYIALAFAAKYAERLRGLMLINTRAAADAPEAARGREELAKAVEQAGSADPVIDRMAPKLFAKATRERRPEVVETVVDRMRRTTVEGTVGALLGMAIRPDRTADLARIPVPTLVLAGAEDQLIPIEESRQMVERLPEAELVVIPEAGHLAPLENPEATTSAILKFLDEHG